MTRRPTAVQLARDVLHWNSCKVAGCDRCYQTPEEHPNRDHRYTALAEPPAVTLARALLRATKEKR